ncbi:Zn-dependent protease with chaperone function [Flavobacterium arsenatis]|uniref:Zn-dependent protease with chaperone function n=1 Tax=Flavobacterium arsenatis TaxID=1484332 RepID=A0ABU1TTF0_9FLAO|nr:M48 family metalloprotease [Flavobacterium arsenatis]MDR6969132.1 Zn-dependent protease with chaperone function [Flavobacterium arsenatis]
MKKIYFSILLSFSFQLIFSQQILLDTLDTAYKKELESFYLERSTHTLAEIDKIANRKVRSEMKAIFLEKKKDFLKDVQDGKFVYHKEFSKLIDEKFEEIKRSNPDVNFDTIKILLKLDESINAYNVGEGIVIFNLPMLINVNDEFEISYIICHEIAHQHLNHVAKSLQDNIEKSNSQEIIEKTKQIKKTKYNKATLATNEIKNFVYKNRIFSRANEHQADSLGFVYFRKTHPEYVHKSIETLKILKFIDKEKDSLAKSDYIKIFENTAINFDENWLEDNILGSYNYQKNSKIWNIDSLRTHPDIDVRVQYIKDNFKIEEKEIAQYSKLKYLDLKSDTKYDEIFMLYYLKEYGKSLYQTMILLKDDKENGILKKMMYDNLSKIETYKQQYKLNKCLQTESPKFSNSYNTFLSFIRNLRKTNFNQILSYYEY